LWIAPGAWLYDRLLAQNAPPDEPMYQPLPHRQEQLEAQHALIGSHPLGLLISHGAAGLEANSIPFLIDPQASKLGTLQAHMARANGQWRGLSAASDVLVIFQGGDHYITPGWYETKRETGKVVPTWNYVMVQARGRPRVIEDAGWLRAQIEALTTRHERARAKPWAVGDAPDDFIEIQIKAIVGVEIEITDIAGKWKASQNRPAADRAGVIAGLEALGDEASLEMASIVRDAATKR
jgi:transcriptional regulator